MQPEAKAALASGIALATGNHFAAVNEKFNPVVRIRSFFLVPTGGFET
jgi:hypothetical protein